MANLKARLRDTEDRMLFYVCTIPSAVVSQAVAAAGADAVIIDMEHGALDHASVHAMIAATAGTKCAPLVRVAENDTTQVKRMLDLGAEGIVFPLVRTIDDARRAVASLRYPPNGTRGFGPFIAQSRWGSSMPTFAADTEDKLVCCLLIETADAIENIDNILAVEGVDCAVTALFDLTVDLGVMGQFTHPKLLDAIGKIEEAARKNNVPLISNITSSEHAKELFAKGYRGIGGFDVLALRANATDLCKLLD